MSSTVSERTGPADERPLTEDERKAVARLFSDPFSFPMSYKTWLIAFLEGSDLQLPLGSVSGLINMIGGGTSEGAGIFALLPAGLMFPCATVSPPTGTFWCDGAAKSRTEYKRLFDAIGTTWGPGDGSNTFNVPDCQNRNLMGAGPGYGVGSNEGRGAFSRGPKHHHDYGTTVASSGSGTGYGGTDTRGNHDHTYQRPGSSSFVAGGSAGGTFGGAAQTGATGDHAHDVSVNVSVNVSGWAGGVTSGGGDLDQASFAACGVIINY